MNRLKLNEDNDGKKKSIALKATLSSIQDDDDDDSNHMDMDEETLTLLARKFGRFLKKNGNQRKPPFNLKKNFDKGKGSNLVPTCHEYGKPGHMKMECSIYMSKMEKHDKRSRRRH